MHATARPGTQTARRAGSASAVSRAAATGSARFHLKPPEPLERDIHKACARALDYLLLPPAIWFSYPAGAAQLSRQQQARYSEIGLKRGLPDLFIFHRCVWGIELKRPGGTLSPTRVARTRRGSPRILEGQVDVFPRLIATGAVGGIAVCTSVDEMLAQLSRWDVPLRCFT